MLNGAPWQGADLAYCSNVHPGEGLEVILENLRTFIAPVRRRRGLDSMATGLWISAAAASQLQGPKALANFQRALDRSGLRLTSLNGFPYGGFHRDRVKANVYRPDWSDPDRLSYTKALAEILAACLPDHCPSGAISTLPLGYKRHWSAAKQASAVAHLAELMGYLEQLERRTGKRILIGLEMEPDCVLESTEELIQFFQQDVRPKMAHPQYLASCFDVCHQAVMHEEVYDSLSRLTGDGICIAKIQLSSALQADLQVSGEADETLLALLRQFSEPKYLHQVKTLDRQDQLVAYADLSLALDDVAAHKLPWRIHFHVPINSGPLLHPQLHSTSNAILRVFDFLADHPQIHPWLEVETYSWQVLPGQLRPKDDGELIDGIAGELTWVEQQLDDRGLLQRAPRIARVIDDKGRAHLGSQ